MGAGAGAAAYAWFDDIYEGARELGVAFTAIGLITPDPATTDSVLKWAGALQNRTDYLIVKNSVSNPSDFTIWEEAEKAKKFREAQLEKRSKASVPVGNHSDGIPPSDRGIRMLGTMGSASGAWPMVNTT